MDLNFYSGLSDGCSSNVDSEFLDSQAYGEYTGENKFVGGGDGYLSISGAGPHFLSAEQTFHTPSLGDEVFEIPPISLHPHSTMGISDAVSHFELTDGTSGSAGSQSLVSNLVVEANDPSFASTFVNLGTGGGPLLSSLALELGNSSGSPFSHSSPVTIDVQLGDMGQGLLGSSHLTMINQSELTLGHHSEAPEQPLSATPSPVGSLQDEDMEDFKRSVLVDSPMLLSSSSNLSHMSLHPAPPSSASHATGRRGGVKPAAAAEAAGGKKVRKKKDPNEPQKPVSAYALFFRDTQVAIKGQNPNASFGEVSKIVASMWDSLAEEQKQTITKIIIPKHMLQAGGQVVTLLPGGVHALQPTLVVSSTPRQPPPLQQMQNAPPPPRLQQMAPTPPPLQAKPQEGGAVQGHAVTVTATPPPPLQIKIVPGSIRGNEAAQIIVPSTAAADSVAASANQVDDVVTVLDSDEDEMEVSACSEPTTVCVRAGCNNPAVDSEDWDKEYCSNECVATHCRDVFKAWCSIRNQNLGTVK
uniref:TOX high mobility group box family member 4 n=1 Tax=Iconisemion striatum TaxID=60296 RepID=A0A1A7WPE1_9TELE